MLMPAKRFQRIFKNCQRKRGELRHMFTKSRAELAQDRMMRMMRINPSNAPTTSTAPFHHTSTSPVSCSSPLSENCEEIQILSPCPSEEASPMNEKPTEQHAELPSTSVQPNENGQETSVVEKRKQSELDETLNSRIEEPSAKRPKTVSSPVEGHKENGNPKADRRLNGSFKKMAPTVRSGINVSNGTENNCASSNRRKSDDNMPASIEELFSF